MQHEKGMEGFFVMLPGKNINNEFIEGIANAMASTLLKDGAAYKWNRDIAYAKVSKFETSGGGLVGSLSPFPAGEKHLRLMKRLLFTSYTSTVTLLSSYHPTG